MQQIKSKSKKVLTMKPIIKTGLLWLSVVAIVVLSACSNVQTNPQEITLEATDIAYNQSTIEVTAGQPVRLTLKDTGLLEHDFSISEIPVIITDEGETMPGHEMGHDEPQLHVAATAGTSNTIEFTPTTPGTYEFFCTVAGHKDAGMVGTLIVK
jgi:uncharacterized cupredoxin-like copper-binding protein